MYPHPDPRFIDHGSFPGPLFAIVPSLLLLTLVALAIYALVKWAREGDRRAVAGAPAPSAGAVATMPSTAPPAVADPALEALRVRYARGEIDREEFVRRTLDLTDGPTPPTSEPGTPSG